MHNKCGSIVGLFINSVVCRNPCVHSSPTTHNYDSHPIAYNTGFGSPGRPFCPKASSAPLCCPFPPVHADLPYHQKPLGIAPLATTLLASPMPPQGSCGVCVRTHTSSNAPSTLPFECANGHSGTCRCASGLGEGRTCTALQFLCVPSLCRRGSSLSSSLCANPGTCMPPPWRRYAMRSSNQSAPLRLQFPSFDRWPASPSSPLRMSHWLFGSESSLHFVLHSPSSSQCLGLLLQAVPRQLEA